ncbi:hypothetical protein I7I48_06111 [Histoplasma ohiense]|nr:hypothetical protein I7I48_06111 [Histoplasma ohiense (nom. inval.)]
MAWYVIITPTNFFPLDYPKMLPKTMCCIGILYYLHGMQNQQAMLGRTGVFPLKIETLHLFLSDGLLRSFPEGLLASFFSPRPLDDPFRWCGSTAPNKRRSKSSFASS